MSRALVAALLFVGTLGSLMAPSAGAAGATLALSASDSVVRDGQTTRLTGTVSGANRRSRIELQLNRARGWTTVDSRRARAGNFAFTVDPPRGLHTYRVVRPAGPGVRRAASRPVSVENRWRPSVEVTADPAFDSMNRPVLRVSGDVRNGNVPNVELHRRLESEGQWTKIETVQTSTGGEFTFSDIVGPRRAEFRVVAPGDANRSRLTANSVVLANPRATYPLKLDQGVTLYGLSVEASATSVSVMPEGSEVTLAGAAPQGHAWRGTVTGPSGQNIGAVGSQSGDQILRFTAPQTGVYTIDVDQLAGDVMTVWASQPKRVEPGATHEHLPGQVIEIHQYMANRQVATLSGIDPTAVEGVVVGAGTRAVLLPPTPRYTGVEVGPVLVSLTDATQVLRLLPRTPETTVATVSLAFQRAAKDVSVNGGAVSLSTSPQRIAVATFEATEGQIIDSKFEFPYAADTPPSHVLYGPDGTQIRCLRHECGPWERRGIAPTAGTYVLLFTDPYGETHGDIYVTSPRELTAEIDGAGASFDMSGEPYRRARIRFSGDAGDIVSITYQHHKSGTRPTYLRFPWLFDNDNRYIEPIWPDGPAAFKLASGESHVFDTYFGDSIATVSVLKAHRVDLPADGRQVPFVVDREDRQLYAQVEAVPGTSLRLSTSSPTMPWWSVYVYGDQGFLDWLPGPGRDESEMTFTVPQNGEVTVFTTGEVGSIDLSLTALN
jgi:hypothetical protein